MIQHSDGWLCRCLCDLVQDWAAARWWCRDCRRWYTVTECIEQGWL